METIYAQLKGNVPTGIHRNFADTPQASGDETWLPVTYGERNPAHDPVKEQVVANRRVEGATVVYEEVVELLPLAQVKVNKLAFLSKEYDELLAAGYISTSPAITLSMVKDARNAFLSLAATAAALAAVAVVVVADKDEVLHDLTAAQVIALAGAFGAAYQSTWVNIARANAAITAATDVDAVMAVALG